MKTLLIVLAVLLGIGLLPVRFDLKYREAFSGRILLWRIPLVKFPGEEKPEKPAKPKKTRRKKKKKKKNEEAAPETGGKPESTFHKLKRQYGIGGLLEMLRELIRILGKTVYRIGRKPYLRQCTIAVCVGAADPAQAAVKYGEICAELYPLTAALWSLTRQRKRAVEVTVDYFTKKIAIDCRIELQLRIYRILGAGVCAGIALLRLLIRAIRNRKDAKQNVG